MLLRRIGRQGERRLSLLQEVVVGRGQVDATRQDRVLVVRLAHRQRALPTEDLGEAGFGRVGAAVLRDGDRRAEVTRQVGEQPAERAEPSPGGADHDQLVGAHRVRR